MQSVLDIELSQDIKLKYTLNTRNKTSIFLANFPFPSRPYLFQPSHSLLFPFPTFPLPYLSPSLPISFLPSLPINFPPYLSISLPTYPIPSLPIHFHPYLSPSFPPYLSISLPTYPIPSLPIHFHPYLSPSLPVHFPPYFSPFLILPHPSLFFCCYPSPLLSFFPLPLLLSFSPFLSPFPSIFPSLPFLLGLSFLSPRGGRILYTPVQLSTGSILLTLNALLSGTNHFQII